MHEYSYCSWKWSYERCLGWDNRKSFGWVRLVIEDNKIIGVITDGDLGRKITVNFLEMKACQVMEKNHKVKPSGAFL